MLWGCNKGIIKGYPDGNFMPDKNISRQELCSKIARYAKHSGTPLTTDKNALSGFRDAGKVGSVFKSDVNALCAFGIVKGYDDETIRPEGNTTRAQAAAMLLRFEDLVTELKKN